MADAHEKLEELDLQSHNLPDEKRDEIFKLFPEARTEGGKLNFERLKQILGGTIDVGKERYGLVWPGKAECLQTIQKPTLATLRPIVAESVNFSSTENIVIEGDNLEVLKLLQKSYIGKVKMIYIDPPYNTGNDFIYPDNYTESLQTYLEFTGQVDGNGKKFSTNTDTNGRFHSRWLNMMWPRLYLARNLLREDGVIFISINDEEIDNLKIICREIFGEDCFVAQFVWNNEGNIDNQSKIKVAHEYILCFSKTVDGFSRPTVIDPNIDKTSKLFNDQVENTIIKNGPGNPPSQIELPKGFPAASDSFTVEPRQQPWPKIHDKIDVKEALLLSPVRVESGWSSKNLLERFIRNDCSPILDSEQKETRFALTSTGAIYIYKKRTDEQGHVLSVIRDVGTSKQNSIRLSEWGLDFPYPKPVLLIQYLCQIAAKSDPEALILDFFPGSGTTAHAVLKLNHMDGGRRKFIMIQLPEPTGNARFATIADICKERIRRVIQDIETEEAGKLDLKGSKSTNSLGFRVYKLAESNFAPWKADVPHNTEKLVEQLELHIDHIREGRTSEDLLYEILLKSGFPLATMVENLQLSNKAVYSVAGGALLICLEENLTLDLIRAIADRRPERIVCLDRGFENNDQLKANAVYTFKSKGITSFKTV